MIRRVAIVALLAVACAAYGQGWDLLGALWTEPMAAASETRRGLVAYWKMDGNLLDETGNNNVISNYGLTLAVGVNGVSNTAYYFNGSSFADAGNSSTLNVTTQFTFLAWAKSENTGYAQFILGKDAVGLRAYDWGFDSAIGGAPVCAQMSGAQVNDVAGIGTAWKHLAIVVSNTTATFYQNGTATVSRTCSIPAVTTNRLCIGRRDYSTSLSYYKGYVDNLRIHNVILTVEEIRAIMREEKP